MKAILCKTMSAVLMGIISMVFTSCQEETETYQGEEENVDKSVKSITIDDTDVISFEYNSQGQLTYVSDGYYNGNYSYQYYTDSVVVIIKYTSYGEEHQIKLKYYLEDERVIKAETEDGVHFIDYDNNGYVSNVRNDWRNVTYTYREGNMVEAKEGDEGVIATYSEYSNKANICLNGILSPEWPLDINDDIDDMVFIPWVKTLGTYSNNLCTNYKTYGFESYNTVDENISYMFDKDGYITQITTGDRDYKIAYYE